MTPGTMRQIWLWSALLYQDKSDAEFVEIIEQHIAWLRSLCWPDALAVAGRREFQDPSPLGFLSPAQQGRLSFFHGTLSPSEPPEVTNRHGPSARAVIRITGAQKNFHRGSKKFCLALGDGVLARQSCDPRHHHI